MDKEGRHLLSKWYKVNYTTTSKMNGRMMEEDSVKKRYEERDTTSQSMYQQVWKKWPSLRRLGTSKTCFKGWYQWYHCCSFLDAKDFFYAVAVADLDKVQRSSNHGGACPTIPAENELVLSSRYNPTVEQKKSGCMYVCSMPKSSLLSLDLAQAFQGWNWEPGVHRRDSWAGWTRIQRFFRKVLVNLP